jgi:hypothetical protein
MKKSIVEMSLVKLLVVLAVQAGLIGAVWAQTPVPGPTTSPATSPPVDPCPIPYVVGEALSGGEMAVRFSSGALGKLAKLPDIGVRGGYEVVKTAYAGVSSQAMVAVFEAYGCRVKNFMRAKGATDVEEKARAVDKAIAMLSIELARIQVASEQGLGAINELKADYIDADTRSERAPVLNAVIINASLADVDPDKLFISQETKKKWASLDVASYASISACGGVVKAAISDGGSTLQRALGNTKSIFINYLNSDVPPYVALASLLNSASANPSKKESYANYGSFKGCTDGVSKVQQDALIAALNAPTPAPKVAPTTPPAPATATAPDNK